MAALTALVYCQILLGATMRHTGGGLAIPDFPLAFGHLVPPFWNAGIALHYAHRLGAILISTVAIANVATIVRRHGGHGGLTRPAWLLVGLVAAQVTLGAFVVLTGNAAALVGALQPYAGKVYQTSLDAEVESQIKAALDGKGVDCELRVYHDEGHGLAKRANRLDAYPDAIAFLVKHLGR